MFLCRLKKYRYNKRFLENKLQEFDDNLNIIDFVYATFDTAVENKIFARALSRSNGNISIATITLYNSGDSKGFTSVNNKAEVMKNLWHFGYLLNTLTKSYFAGY